jgi:predicted AAA+ superfamily ATPase
MIHRDIEDQLEPWLFRDKIIILKGARQVGKTTILKSVQEKLEKQGRMVRYIAADLDFADPMFGDPRLFLLRLDDLFAGKDGTVLIDEFQMIPQAGLFLKTIYDRRKARYRFIVSGSSSLELSKNAEFLTGRKIEFIVRPFSFREFVRARGVDIPDRLLDPIDEAALRDHAELYGAGLKALFSEYLRYGGYPEVVLVPADLRRILLKELLSTYIRKDVAGFQRVENTAGFNNLVRLLSSQIGSQVNRSELASTLRLNQETVARYLDILEGTFVLKLVAPWFTNPRKEVSKMPKVFLADPGMALASGARSTEATSYELLDGHAVENAIWSSLSGSYPAESIKYWRSAAGAEIDFIVESETGILPIEVKFTSVDPSEPIAMRNFKATYPAALPGIIVSRDSVSVPKAGNAPLILPAYLVDFIAWPEDITSRFRYFRPGSHAKRSID